MADVLQIKHAVRERDGFTCAQCGLSNDEHVAQTRKQLEVHRIIPGSVYTVEGCVTLCRTCHVPQLTVGLGRDTLPRLEARRQRCLPVHPL